MLLITFFGSSASQVLRRMLSLADIRV
ncbi:MAG: hypothetical protein F6K56_04065 [Moorea sp. SIO3G5]|nr:hypothetical protein [Moorena sp. SIO3G5]